VGTVLDRLGISGEGRVATFGWNTARHLELYFAAPCTGRVLHTLNIRLFPDQLTYIVNHAADEVIFVDRSLAARRVRPHQRREPRRVDVLHERHHRQPQGRGVHPPLHVPAHDGGVAGRRGGHP
jgi:acyl-CoA synthetase (AMP-forming)/AMP-acid ligase II